MTEIKIKWAIQPTLSDKETCKAIAETAVALGGSTVTIPQTLFATDLPEMDVRVDEPVIFYATGPFIEMIHNAGYYSPGVFFDPVEFNYMRYIENNGDKMLNSDAELHTLADVIYREDRFFIRPVDDLKLFAGELATYESQAEWQGRLMTAGVWDLQKTEIIVASEKEILAEYRAFIVEGEIVDVTRYASNGKVSYERMHPMMEAKIAEFMSDAVYPHKICVADIALSGQDLKIIEFNCMNGSGFYNHDIPKIIGAINNVAAMDLDC